MRERDRDRELTQRDRVGDRELGERKCERERERGRQTDRQRKRERTKERERERETVAGPLTDVGVSSAHPQNVDLPNGVRLGLLDGGGVRRLLAADVDDLHRVLLVRGLLHHTPHRAADAPATHNVTHTSHHVSTAHTKQHQSADAPASATQQRHTQVTTGFNCSHSLQATPVCSCPYHTAMFTIHRSPHVSTAHTDSRQSTPVC